VVVTVGECRPGDQTMASQPVPDFGYIACRDSASHFMPVADVLARDFEQFGYQRAGELLRARLVHGAT
jgi:hypothetical protein